MTGNSGSDYLDTLIELENAASSGTWYAVKDPDLDTVWISADSDKTTTIALLDYGEEAQNVADADLIVFSRNNMKKITEEIKSLRERVTNLLEENDKNIDSRVKLQNELNALKSKK